MSSSRRAHGASGLGAPPAAPGRPWHLRTLRGDMVGMAGQTPLLGTRGAELGDVPQIVALAAADAQDGAYGPGVTDIPQAFANMLVAVVRDGVAPMRDGTDATWTRQRCYVAVAGPEVVGFLLSAVDPTEAIVDGRGVVELRMCSVAPRYRREGVATALMMRALRDLAGGRTRAVRVRCRCVTPAIAALLAKFRFRADGTDDGGLARFALP